MIKTISVGIMITCLVLLVVLLIGLFLNLIILVIGDAVKEINDLMRGKNRR